MIIGLTGGIGAGKSYVAERLRNVFGIPVYDCDREAKRLNEESPIIRQALTQLVGHEVYGDNGKLHRSVLAAYLFASPRHASLVNAIVHPVVACDFQQWASQTEEQQRALRNTEQPIVAMESAILFESGFSRLVDKVICVTAPIGLRIERAMQRDNASRESIEQRIRQQMSDEERLRRSDFSVINDGQDIATQLALIINKLNH